MTLQIVAKNTDDDIEQFKTEQRRLPIHCKYCGNSWRATIGEMIDDPTCRKCKR